MEFDPNERVATCSDEHAAPPISSIEAEFSIPTILTRKQERRLVQLLDEIVNEPWNTPVEGVHWMSGGGSKPLWSRTDAMFLGKPIDPNAPESGEPSFDISVWHLESSARGFANERERERELRKRAAGDEQGLPEDPEIRAIVDRMLKASEPSDGEDKEDLWTIAREFHEWRKRAKNG